MSPSDQENDHSAFCMLCPMGLSRGNATPCSGQGTEAKVAGLEQVSGGVKRGASSGDIPSSSWRKTPSEDPDSVGRCEPI